MADKIRSGRRAPPDQPASSHLNSCDLAYSQYGAQTDVVRVKHNIPSAGISELPRFGQGWLEFFDPSPLLEFDSARVQRFGMTTPQIRAIIEDGPRAGESIVLDADAGDSPPPEIMLPDGHMGVRTHAGAVDRPTHSVSRYRLIGPADGSNFRYKVVPHDE